MSVHVQRGGEEETHSSSFNARFIILIIVITQSIQDATTTFVESNLGLRPLTGEVGLDEQPMEAGPS